MTAGIQFWTNKSESPVWDNTDQCLNECTAQHRAREKVDQLEERMEPTKDIMVSTPTLFQLYTITVKFSLLFKYEKTCHHHLFISMAQQQGHVASNNFVRSVFPRGMLPYSIMCPTYPPPLGKASNEPLQGKHK